MSVKNNALMAAVYLAVGVSAPAVAASPVLENLLNDYSVKKLHAVQVDDIGRCIVLAEVQVGSEAPALRPVCNALGDVKLYADMGAVYPVIKRSKLVIDAPIAFYRKDKMLSLGDPVAMLKSQYKAFKAEKLAVDKSKLVIDSKIVAADALGWGASIGTPERLEYNDYVARRASTNEAIAFCAARITALAASLTAAGFDPATVV